MMTRAELEAALNIGPPWFIRSRTNGPLRTGNYTLGWVDATEWRQLDQAIVEHIQNLLPFKGDITVDVFLSQALEPINGGRWVPVQEQVFRAWYEKDGYHYANCGCEVLPSEINGGILPALFPHQFNLEAGRQV